MLKNGSKDKRGQKSSFVKKYFEDKNKNWLFVFFKETKQNTYEFAQITRWWSSYWIVL